jgi:hypothetical protein
MFRLIRWLCFPVARRFGVWPMAVYFGILIPLTAVRWIWFPPSGQALAYVPVWLFPALYAIFFVVFPLWVWFRNRSWYEIPQRKQIDTGT